MANTKLSLHQRSIPDKIQFTRQIVASMTGNANYLTPSPDLEDITVLEVALENAYNAALQARNAAQEATADQDTADQALDSGLSALASYVDNASGGDEAKILSAGIPVRDEPAPVGLLPAPQNLGAAAGDLEGEIDLNWNRVPSASSYLVQHRPEQTPAAEWGSDKVCTKSRFTVEGLQPGTRHWFRVAAIGSAGQGPWSDPATAMAV